MSIAKGTALITGASSGIGAMYADRLAARGHDVVLVARRKDRLETLADTLRFRHGHQVEVLAADLADEAGVAGVEEVVRETPDLAILVNCAGSGALGTGVMVEPAAVDAMLRVNVLALTRLSLLAARRFEPAGCGTIINIGSILAAMPVPGAGAYGGSKSYVLNFSRSLQAELTDSGVTVQVVMPGPVRSEFFGDKPPPFPDQLFMSPETLVDAALAALEQGETITFPNLPNLEVWRQFEGARGTLVKAVTQSGLAAPRYADPRTVAVA